MHSHRLVVYCKSWMNEQVFLQAVLEIQSLLLCSCRNNVRIRNEKIEVTRGSCRSLLWTALWLDIYSPWWPNLLYSLQQSFWEPELLGAVDANFTAFLIGLFSPPLLFSQFIMKISGWTLVSNPWTFSLSWWEEKRLQRHWAWQAPKVAKRGLGYWNKLIQEQISSIKLRIKISSPDHLSLASALSSLLAQTCSLLCIECANLHLLQLVWSSSSEQPPPGCLKFPEIFPNVKSMDQIGVSPRASAKTGSPYFIGGKKIISMMKDSPKLLMGENSTLLLLILTPNIICRSCIVVTRNSDQRSWMVMNSHDQSE